MEAKAFLLTNHLLSVKEKPCMISMFDGSRKKQKQRSSKIAINTVRWAARVLVNNEDACRHGRTEIGLPSNVGIFSKQKAASKIREKFTEKLNNFLSIIGINSSSRKERIEVKISEANDFNIMPLCSIDVSSLDPKLSDDKWMGPKIKLFLPSFSGRTGHLPPLLKYTCQIECRIRAIPVAKVSGNTSKHDDDDANNNRLALAEDDKGLHKCISIMLSKPVLALEFNFLKMQVNAPMMVSDDLGTLS